MKLSEIISKLESCTPETVIFVKLFQEKIHGNTEAVLLELSEEELAMPLKKLQRNVHQAISIFWKHF